MIEDDKGTHEEVRPVAQYARGCKATGGGLSPLPSYCPIHGRDEEADQPRAEAHSPLPWTSQGLVVMALDAETVICTTNIIGKPYDEARANAEFIVWAVNSHQALLDNARLVLDGFGYGVFVRDVSAVRALPYTTALARLEAAINQLEASGGSADSAKGGVEMAKQSQLEKAIAALDGEIAVLQAAKARLVAQRGKVPARTQETLATALKRAGSLAQEA